MTTIYLDMDGVCCNFVRAVCGIFNRDYEDIVLHWPKEVYSVTVPLGITEEALQTRINEYGRTFWTSLEEFAHFKRMYKNLQAYGEVVFLTSPTWNPKSHEGKVGWLQDRFGIDFDHYVLTRQKHRCANNRSVLIDDHPENCEKFVAHGGHAILYPSPGWPVNRVGEFPDDYVMRQMEIVQAEIKERLHHEEEQRVGLLMR